MTLPNLEPIIYKLFLFQTVKHPLYQKEIDFVAMKRDEKLYIQVSYDINEEATFQREISPLFQIKDAYPKILLARIRHPETDYEGVRIIDVAEWLCSEK